MICMLFLFVAGTENAYAQNSAEIEAVSSTVEKGGTAKVALNISGNPGIWGLKFKVGYDHTAMTLKSVEVGDVFAEDEVLMPDSLDSDYFMFYATGNEIANISANGTLMVLEFQVSDTAAEADYAVTLELIQCINADGNDVNLTMTDAKVTVINCFHSHTEIINAAEATEEKDGYTGDTYCNDCKQVIEKGTDIPKLDKPQEPEQPEKPKEELPETGQPVSPMGVLVVLFTLAIAGDMILMKKKLTK